jgi:hypothetical protein
MEQSGRNRPQTARKPTQPLEPRKQAQTVAMGCDCLPRSKHGKEGVDGNALSDRGRRSSASSALPAGVPPIHEVFRLLVEDPWRTTLVCDDVLSALAEGRRCLVLSHWKQHCHLLAEAIRSRGISPFLLEGGLGKRARAALLDQIENTPADEPLVVIATGQYLGEGFDCPQLDTLFLAFLISFKGRLIQYTGRIMRAHAGKMSARVYDYADIHVPVLRAMHTRRLSTYKTLGFTRERQTLTAAASASAAAPAPRRGTEHAIETTVCVRTDCEGHHQGAPVDIMEKLYKVYIVSWEVEYTNEFEAWWETFDEEDQEAIDAAVELLEERGPALGRPLADNVHRLGIRT